MDMIFIEKEALYQPKTVLSRFSDGRHWKRFAFSMPTIFIHTSHRSGKFNYSIAIVIEIKLFLYQTNSSVVKNMVGIENYL